MPISSNRRARDPVDPTLVRFAADIERLKTNGIAVERFNLSQDPVAFVANSVVADGGKRVLRDAVLAAHRASVRP